MHTLEWCEMTTYLWALVEIIRIHDYYNTNVQNLSEIGCGMEDGKRVYVRKISFLWYFQNDNL